MKRNAGKRSCGKRLLALALVSLLALSLCACGEEKNTGNSQNNVNLQGNDNISGGEKTSEGSSSDDENSGSADAEKDTSKPSDKEVYLQGYQGGFYEWKSEDGDVVKQLSVDISADGAVEIQMENQQYASYNDLSEAGTFTPIIYEMSGDIAGEAAFELKIETVTVTYKKYPDEPLIYKRVR